MTPVGWAENEANGCWEWQGYIDPQGYGMKTTKERVGFAHRMIYEERVGPIPPGLHLDHLCSNRKCVNPDHLEPVTPAVNVRRSAATNLDWGIVGNIRAEGAAELAERQARGYKTRTPGFLPKMARKYGVSVSCITQVLSGYRWGGEPE